MVDSADLSRLSISREPRSPSSQRRLWLLPSLAIGLVVVLVGGTALVRALRDRPLEVRLASAELRGGGAGGAGLTANGYVVARTKASISSKVAGRLAYLGVEEGDRVAAGAVVARLEATEYQAAVRQAAAEVLAAEATRHEADAQVAQARRLLARARALAKDSLATPEAFEDAQTGLAAAEARDSAAVARWASAREALAGARAALDASVIRAPFAGTILRKDAEVGEVVAPAVAGGGLTRGAVVTMADLSTLEVEVDVNEAYIAGVKPDQGAEIVLDAYPNESFPGHVRQVVPTADRQKATVLVRVAIDSRDSRILPEMAARVVFREPTETPAAGRSLPARVYVPAGAVGEAGGRDVVWVVLEGRARQRQVDVGPVMGGEREVRRGLSGGESLVVDAPAGLVEGTRVKASAGKEAA